mgnify:CR=1 FL=1
MAVTDLDLGKYKLGWSDAEDYVFKPKKGLDEALVREMSQMKGEPEWMLKRRLKSLGAFEKRPMPRWGGDMSEIFFNDIYYYIKPTDHQVDSWDDLPDAIKSTYEKLGIPEAERKYLAGVTAQFESEVVFHRNREDLEQLGIIFCDMDTALREYPELVKQYFGTVIPLNDNKFSSLNTAVWSGGSFIYVPPGVKVPMPLQAYFRINQENMGQFERTLIIADEGSEVHYIEGCSAPVYTSDSLHSAVVEIVVKEGVQRIEEIISWGAQFDKESDGDYKLGKEGGHSEYRILHHKDVTGREMERALLAAIAKRAPQTLDDLQGISGIGAKKLEAYAQEVLRVVNAG